MVKKYLLFDRFDFLCRFFSRFFNNDFFLVVQNLRVLHRISPYMIPSSVVPMYPTFEVGGNTSVPTCQFPIPNRSSNLNHEQNRRERVGSF